MKCIVGLGNPGPKYQNTRHNIGYLVLDELAKKLGLSFKFDAKFNAEVAIGSYEGVRSCFIKPSTYMNLSGEAIQKIMKYYAVPIEELLVIVDDIHLETGKLRLREKGGHGGHNGLRNIIGLLQDNEFKRVRIGIDHYGKIPLDHYVLGKFDKEQEIPISHAIKHSVDIVLLFLKAIPFKDIMTQYNTQT
jgi:PTH1 family peptidyl-tRNA hydrolase